MTSILLRLTRPITKCVEYGSCLGILRNQGRYLRLAIRNYTEKCIVSLIRLKFTLYVIISQRHDNI